MVGAALLWGPAPVTGSLEPPRPLQGTGPLRGTPGCAFATIVQLGIGAPRCSPAADMGSPEPIQFGSTVMLCREPSREASPRLSRP